MKDNLVPSSITDYIVVHVRNNHTLKEETFFGWLDDKREEKWKSKSAELSEVLHIFEGKTGSSIRPNFKKHSPLVQLMRGEYFRELAEEIECFANRRAREEFAFFSSVIDGTYMNLYKERFDKLRSPAVKHRRVEVERQTDVYKKSLLAAGLYYYMTFFEDEEQR